jgi:hypothetical protein
VSHSASTTATSAADGSSNAQQHAISAAALAAAEAIAAAAEAAYAAEVGVTDGLTAADTAAAAAFLRPASSQGGVTVAHSGNNGSGSAPAAAVLPAGAASGNNGSSNALAAAVSAAQQRQGAAAAADTELEQEWQAAVQVGCHSIGIASCLLTSCAGLCLPAFRPHLHCAVCHLASCCQAQAWVVIRLCGGAKGILIVTFTFSLNLLGVNTPCVAHSFIHSGCRLLLQKQNTSHMQQGTVLS